MDREKRKPAVDRRRSKLVSEHGGRKNSVDREWTTAGQPQPTVPSAPGPVPGQDPPQTYTLCAAPDVRTPTQFRIPFRQPILLENLLLGVAPKPTDPITCTKLDGLQSHLALDPRFEQVWNLQKLSIGDLSATVSLAPLERLELEFRSSQRQLLERSVLESAESVQSSESSAIDKEAINVTRSSSKTSGWHFDTTGTLTVGYASLSQTIGYSESVTDSNQQAINKTSERTRKSAESLKSLHKIEVKGKTETFVQNRMTRLLINPYKDRTLALNVFQLLKHYSVSTALVDTRLAIIVAVDHVVFDADFVVSNADFLRDTLTDSSLIDDLTQAVQGAKADLTASAPSYELARTIAERAIHYLFFEPNIFNLPTRNGRDSNSPALSMDANLPTFGDTGLGDALVKNMGLVFMSLNLFFKVAADAKLRFDQSDNAIRLAVALANDIDASWSKIFADPAKVPDSIQKEAFDDTSFSEVLRRVPGFLAMVKGMLVPLLEPATAEQDAAAKQEQARYALARLITHLNCNMNFYIQRYLRYVWTKTTGAAVVTFVRRHIAYLSQNNLFPAFLLTDDFDVEGSFIDKQEIVIPGMRPLSGDQLAAIGTRLSEGAGDAPPQQPPVVEPDPAIIELEVPADGIHLEVAPGACVLAEVPDPLPSGSLAFEVANIKGNASSV